MAGGRFEAVLSMNSGEPQSQGIDEVEFTVSANPGQPLKPLTRVASGGELSRISLAVQVASAGRRLRPAWSSMKSTPELAGAWRKSSAGS